MSNTIPDMDEVADRYRESIRPTSVGRLQIEKAIADVAIEQAAERRQAQYELAALLALAGPPGLVCDYLADCCEAGD